MTTFSYDDLKVGDKVIARRVRHVGQRESDDTFGPWQAEEVSHVQRDRKGNIACLAFAKYVEFDPRHDWNGSATWPCLINGPYELQIIGRDE